jgi:hypothetical protein
VWLLISGAEPWSEENGGLAIPQDGVDGHSQTAGHQDLSFDVWNL